jgi:AcrR family transcriptional regulator
MPDQDAIVTEGRRRRKEARPQELIEAGFLEFAEHGFAATRLDDVARRAGAAKGTIYRYFEDKEALFMAAVRSRISPTLADMRGTVLAFPGSTEDLIRLLIRTLYARLVESDLKVLLRIIVGEGAAFPTLAEMYHREVISRGRELLSAVVARGVERGELRAGPATDLPIVIMAPAVMATIWALTFDRVDPIAADRFLAAHVDLVLHGILAKPIE